MAVSFVLALALPSFAEENTDALEVIRKMDKLLRGETVYGVYEMRIEDPRWSRTLKLKVWDKREGKKMLILILSPAKEKGIVTLKHGNQLWNYLPRVERTIKLPPSMMMQSWMGSDFTNDDLVKESSIVNDYIHTMIGVEELDGKKAYRIESIPKPDAPVVWGSIIAYVDADNFMPVKQLFYSEKGELVRTMEFKDVRKLGGRVVPTTYEIIPVKKKGRKTIMKILELEFDKEIPDDIFSLKSLKRVR